MVRFFNSNSFLVIVICLFVSSVFSCSENNSSDNRKSISPNEKKFYSGIGVGPVMQLQIPEAIDENQSGEGEKIFQAKCSACHQLTDERKIGPGLKGITLRRKPEWIMNQILNPLEMTKNDSLSKELLSIYLSQMTDMNLTREDARCVLEYFRKLDKQ